MVVVVLLLALDVVAVVLALVLVLVLVLAVGPWWWVEEEEEEVVEEANERESDEGKGDVCLSTTVGEVPRVASLDDAVKLFVDCCLPLLPVAVVGDPPPPPNNSNDDDDDDDAGDEDDDDDANDDDVMGEDLCVWFSIFLCCRDNPEGDLLFVVDEGLEVLEGE